MLVFMLLLKLLLLLTFPSNLPYFPIRPSMMPRGEGRMSSDTTYHVDYEENATYSGLRPKSRYDPAHRKRDSLDWM